jgi:enoyl-CoA hydratase/carnithine racemase
MTAVRAEAEGDVLVVTIDRPEARNAVNLAVAEGIAAALDRLDGDDGLRAGVLTGAGGTFCAGMDLKAFVAGERPHVEGRGFAGIVQGPPRKPLIAAVEGWALAGGFEVALACDLIVAARDARFGIPEVKRGLVAAGGALIRLPRRIPYHLAMELALTGDPISAERAAELGIVSRLAERGRRSLRRWGSRARSPPTGRWRLTRASASSLPTRVTRGSARPRSSGRCSRPRTLVRARSPLPRSARRSGVGADERQPAVSPWSVTTTDRGPPRERCSHR